MAEVLSIFPESAAGYTRGELRQYGPGVTNFSIAYEVLEPELQNAVSLFFYQDSRDLAAAFESGKQEIIQRHEGAELLREGSTTLTKDGVSYEARVAVFAFTGSFMGRVQPLYSQLILLSQPKRYFKLRSTAPIALASVVESKNKQLLEAVNWAYSTERPAKTTTGR